MCVFQFVALYKDPKGVNVFKKASAVTTLDITSESVMATCKTNDVLEERTTVPTRSDDIPHWRMTQVKKKHTL